ncbi:hypothetical protein MINTMi27_15240 [Mycobacterium intracellulare]|uniref:hypothetical protein n=1 Tax=Mycobacterium intracellulare TaxID=1767 RepID=UPI00192966ED|nr:hypothetical protein [Mycobacterium intracellulare]BCP41431.1 hypothetical protein MINTMi27_15240 [Mycobacterium intracellulare]
MTTGELWTSLDQINANNIRKWLYGSVLVRDWDPSGTTTLEDFSPFESDGSLSSTLFSADNPGGPWFDVGAIDVNGVDFTPRYKTADTDIWQNRLPQRTDVDSDGEDIMIVFAETNPVALALYNNQPLVDVPGTGAKSVLQSIGTSNFTQQYSITPQIIYRQLLIIGVDGELADPIYVAELRPRVSLTKLDKRQFNAKKPDDFGVSFGVYPDPASGFAKQSVYGGSAWLAMGGPVALPTSDTVTATAQTGGKATLVFNEPTSPNQPFTYSVSGDNTTTSTTAAATVDSTAVANGVVTLTVSGLTSSDSYTFTVTATAANLKTAAYPASNSVTALA